MSEKNLEQEKDLANEDSKAKEAQVPLTEWQQRNLDFLAKKKKEAKEEEQKREEERLEKLALYGKTPPTKETDNESKVAKKKPKKPAKKKKVKKEKKVKVKKPKTARQKALLKALPLIIGLCLLILLCLFVISPYSKEKKVTVSGNTHSQSDAIIKDANIQSSDYIWSLILYANRYEERLIKADPWVESAKLTYHFPNDFSLDVKEYGVLGYISTDGGYQPVLTNGDKAPVISSSELPSDFLIITVTDDNMLTSLAKALIHLDSSLRDSIQSISLAGSQSTSDLLTLEMRDGNTVRVPLSELTSKLPYYSKIRTGLSAPAIVDMEVGIYATNSDIEEAKTADSSVDNQENTETQTQDTSADISDDTSAEAQNNQAQEAQETPEEEAANIEAANQETQQQTPQQ
ncbi:cell division protein FtsQ/DivIB [Streptococcus sp. zg-JUN1979]|uniref:cell division protein FtsQ/DivIB n=1 Tax=Streptococcus sp. zg-JUN1979 TaxID=3391450 RepID=UPI0039A4DFB5